MSRPESPNSVDGLECTDCGGTGVMVWEDGANPHIITTDTCTTCGGTGVITHRGGKSRKRKKNLRKRKTKRKWRNKKLSHSRSKKQ